MPGYCPGASRKLASAVVRSEPGTVPIGCDRSTPGTRHKNLVLVHHHAAAQSGVRNRKRQVAGGPIFSADPGVLRFLGTAAGTGASHLHQSEPVRPILFVHGFLEDSSAWGSGSSSGLRGQIITDLSSNPEYSNTSNYDLYLSDSDRMVHISTGSSASSSDPIAAGNIPCNARFFSIRFIGWSGLSTDFDPDSVAGVSIITKAYELSEVIQAITAATYVKDVILVAHSMGALDSRAYMEGMGSTYVCVSTPCTVANYQVPYTDDVAQLITVDGANSGANDATLIVWLTNSDFFDVPLNVDELTTGSTIVQALNYNDVYVDAANTAVKANDLPAQVTALITYFNNDTWEFCALSPLPSCGSDGAVQTDSQSIEVPLRHYSLTNQST